MNLEVNNGRKDRRGAGEKKKGDGLGQMYYMMCEILKQ